VSRKPNPRQNPFGIDYFSPSCTAIELVRFYTPFQRFPRPFPRCI